MNIQQPSIVGFSINETADSPGDHAVRASVALELSDETSKTKDFVLWSGEEYDNVGDWTQAQAEARVLELLS